MSSARCFQASPECRSACSSKHYLSQKYLFNPHRHVIIPFLYMTEPGPTEKAVAPHSSTLVRKTPWMEEPDGLQSMGSLRVGHAEQIHFHFSLSCIGEGNGNPLQCSCLENPRDGGAWWAAIYGVAESRTQLRRLSSSSKPEPKRLRNVFSVTQVASLRVSVQTQTSLKTMSFRFSKLCFQ